MSDCSTQAMKPKEPPKTCGSLTREFRNIQDHCRYEREGSVAGSFHCYDVTGSCFDRWVDEVEGLEQRYQQLEQVARDMWNFFRLISDDLGFEASFTHDVTKESWSLEVFRNRLEVLGVSLDD